jgi:formylglycine-generating enzyme required for sulfatase activity
MQRLMCISIVVIAGSSTEVSRAEPPAADTSAETVAPDKATAETGIEALRQQFYDEMENYVPPPMDSIIINSRTGLSLEFVYVPPGKYTVGRNIGSTERILRLMGQQASRLDEGPERQITFERGFYLARCQATAAQFATFLNDVDPDVATKSAVLNSRSNLQRDASGRYSVKEGAHRFPANTVTWDGAVEFTKWITEKSGWSMRLPTEDEWEAAARTQQGFLGPTGGPKPPIDAQTGLMPGGRPGSPYAEVDAYPENMTINGIFHTYSIVGDWTSSVYKFDRVEKPAPLEDALVVKREGGHVVKGRGCLTGRALGNQVGEDGIFGFRVLLEANEDGSPARSASTTLAK